MDFVYIYVCFVFVFVLFYVNIGKCLCFFNIVKMTHRIVRNAFELAQKTDNTCYASLELLPLRAVKAGFEYIQYSKLAIQRSSDKMQ